LSAESEYEVERRKRGLTREPADEDAQLDANALHEATRERFLREAEPYVRTIRAQVFGSEEPPWRPTQFEQARTWVLGRLNGERRPSPAEGDQADALCHQLGKLDRSRIIRERPILYLDGEPFPLYTDSSLVPLADAAERIAGVTGFSKSAVTGWILSGEEPSLPRVRIKVRDSMADLGGRRVGGRSVVLEFETKIFEPDFRRLFRQVRAAFDHGQKFREVQSGRHGPSITALDLHLERIVAEMPDATWEQRAEAWRRQPPKGVTMKEWIGGKRRRQGKAKGGDVTGAALRIRWKRLQGKVGRNPSKV
jgi:hypothetical protein